MGKNKSIIDRLRIDDDYYGKFGEQFLSNSDIKILREAPERFHQKTESTLPMVQGGYFHTSILEPEKIGNYEIIDVSSRRVKKYIEAVDESDDDILLLNKDKEMLDELKDILLSKNHIKTIIDGCEKKEEPMIKGIEGIMFKGKADLINEGHGFIYDLKTTSDIAKFYWSVRTYGYDSQGWIYRELFGLPMCFIVICKKTKQVGMFTLSEESYSNGKRKVMEGIDNYNLYYGDEASVDVSQHYIVGEV